MSSSPLPFSPTLIEDCDCDLFLKSNVDTAGAAEGYCQTNRSTFDSKPELMNWDGYPSCRERSLPSSSHLPTLLCPTSAAYHLGESTSATPLRICHLISKSQTNLLLWPEMLPSVSRVLIGPSFLRTRNDVQSRAHQRLCSCSISVQRHRLPRPHGRSCCASSVKQ